MTTDEQTSPAVRLRFEAGQTILELGYDKDVDHELREAIEQITGKDLVDDYDGVADAVLLWFREADGDLTGTLVDALTCLTADGAIWLLVPKSGQPGYVDPSDIGKAAPTAGLVRTTSISVSKNWTGTRLVSPKR